ncbi:hypothetical protein GGP62_003105 [Salinibacter ruber]|jgi:hypothetical protein|uniref:Uncharacterized protein n=1 Tax=Salinibacter ruber TaxID=146919 RepID=A0A9X2U565_9BACT|nr:hypothetical protein [Salinibacter ruber]MCS3755072.1 hypothetical protein [Salinibacter ruber]MCS3854708.1 hypothetical protein [Salinibacter ruber]MCS3860192.1 hypothetical protein [Salinibacter ruber]MCS3867020.1 hypothetical protein [Salinibacter ruber]
MYLNLTGLHEADFHQADFHEEGIFQVRDVTRFVLPSDVLL